MQKNLQEDKTELYRGVISDHNRNPKGFGKPESFTHSAKGQNKSKGDEIEVYITIENDRLEKANFVGSGGAVFTASASIMTELIEGKTIANALSEFEKFVGIFRSEIEDEEILGKLIIFSGIKAFPDRVKCAVLPWYTMKAAIECDDKIVSTEIFNQ